MAIDANSRPPFPPFTREARNLRARQRAKTGCGCIRLIATTPVFSLQESRRRYLRYCPAQKRLRLRSRSLIRRTEAKKPARQKKRLKSRSRKTVMARIPPNRQIRQYPKHGNLCTQRKTARTRLPRGPLRLWRNFWTKSPGVRTKSSLRLYELIEHFRKLRLSEWFANARHKAVCVGGFHHGVLRISACHKDRYF